MYDQMVHRIWYRIFLRTLFMDHLYASLINEQTLKIYLNANANYILLYSIGWITKALNDRCSMQLGNLHLYVLSETFEFMFSCIQVCLRVQVPYALRMIFRAASPLCGVLVINPFL